MGMGNLEMTWSKYGIDISFWPEFKKSSEFKKIFDIKLATNYFCSIFDEVYKKKLILRTINGMLVFGLTKGFLLRLTKTLLQILVLVPKQLTPKILKKNIKPRKYHKILPLKHVDQLVRDKPTNMFLIL